MINPWICPRCNVVNSPAMMQCTCKEQELTIASTSPYLGLNDNPHIENDGINICKISDMY